MKKLIISLTLFFPLFGFSQLEHVAEALKFHNQIRNYHFVDDLMYDENLAKKAQKWADKLAELDMIRVSSDSLGENIYNVRKITETTLKSFNPFLDASIHWALGEDILLDQVKDEDANLVGFGLSENKKQIYVVAKYDNVIRKEDDKEDKN